MMKKVFCQGYLWLLLLLLYSPIFIIIIFSFTEAKVMGNWTGFSLQLYKNLFAEGTHHSLTAALVNTVTIAPDYRNRIHALRNPDSHQHLQPAQPLCT